jgi:hypothetical protein
MEGESYHEEGRRLEEEEEEEAEELSLRSMRVAKVLEHVAFLFEPKLRTKMNQPPVMRGGVELQASRDHVGGRGRAQ